MSDTRTPVVLDEAAEERARRALFEFAQDVWGWGSREYGDVVSAVQIVLDAVEAT